MFTSGSGEVDFEEFIGLLKKMLAPPSDEDLMMKFKVIKYFGLLCYFFKKLFGDKSIHKYLCDLIPDSCGFLFFNNLSRFTKKLGNENLKP